MMTDIDPYHQNRLNYLIGVVKSYMGYYDEALPIFVKTQNYFTTELNKQQHPNILYDCRRGYFNSLHQLADSIVSDGLTRAQNLSPILHFGGKDNRQG